MGRAEGTTKQDEAGPGGRAAGRAGGGDAGREGAAGPVKRAGLAARAGANGLDVLFLVALSCAVLPLMRLIARGLHGTVFVSLAEDDLWSAGVTACALLYFSTELFGRATPGKYVLSMFVAAADRGTASAGRRALRSAVRNLPLLLLLVGGMLKAYRDSLPPTSPGYESVRLATLIVFRMAWGSLIVLAAGLVPTAWKPRLALHDRLTGTAVYRRPVPPSPPTSYRRSRWTSGYWALQALVGSD